MLCMNEGPSFTPDCALPDRVSSQYRSGGYGLCVMQAGKMVGGGSGGRHGNENENGKQVQTK